MYVFYTVKNKNKISGKKRIYFLLKHYLLYDKKSHFSSYQNADTCSVPRVIPLLADKGGSPVLPLTSTVFHFQGGCSSSHPIAALLITEMSSDPRAQIMLCQYLHRGLGSLQKHSLTGLHTNLPSPVVLFKVRNPLTSSRSF